MDTSRVSVEQAAQELKLNVATVRYWIKTGQLPIGRYVRGKGTKRGTYMIFRDKLDRELGKEVCG